jgi:hypothetical protein
MEPKNHVSSGLNPRTALSQTLLHIDKNRKSDRLLTLDAALESFLNGTGHPCGRA